MQKILIIEDDEKLRKEFEIFLNNNGYESISLKTFENTLNDILEIKPKLLLLDINLPGIDGEYICKELRKKSNVPTIIITSRDNEIDELLSISNGADHYITKPFNIHILFKDHDTNLLADKSLTKEELLKVLEEFYPKEEQVKYGVLGIRIKLL